MLRCSRGRELTIVRPPGGKDTACGWKAEWGVYTLIVAALEECSSIAGPGPGCCCEWGRTGAGGNDAAALGESVDGRLG